MKKKQFNITFKLKDKIKTIAIVLCIAGSLLVTGGTLNAAGNAAGSPYTLDAFLSRVKEHSKDIKLAKKDLDMADVYKKEALATALPKIQLTADYKRNLKENYLYVEFPDFETGEMSDQKFKINYKNEYGLQAVVNQTLFSFKVGAALRAAKQYRKLTDHVYDAKHRAIMTIARKAFYQVLLLKQVSHVAEASENNAKDNYRQMKKKYDHGQISHLQLLQAETRWKNLMPETAKAQRNYQLALNSIKTLAGFSPSEKLELTGHLDHIPSLPPVEELDTVLERRPDFKALQWEEKLRGTSIKSEKANLYPTLSLNLIYNFSSMSDKFKFQNKNTSYIIGLNVNVPIFMGGYNRAQVQKAKIELDKARINIEREKDTIATDLRNIYLRMQEARTRLNSARNTVKTAEKAFKIAEVTAANGLATQLELKDARIMFDQSKLNRAAAAYDYLAAYYDWKLAVGR